MRMKPPPLLPILRSQQQGRLLAALFLHPGRESAVAELAQLVGAPLSTMHREVAQLVEAGILRVRIVARTRLVSARVDRPLGRALTELLAVTYGPQTVVGDEFGAIDDVDLVLTSGRGRPASTASRGRRLRTSTSSWSTPMPPRARPPRRCSR